MGTPQNGSWQERRGGSEDEEGLEEGEDEGLDKEDMLRYALASEELSRHWGRAPEKPKGRAAGSRRWRWTNRMPP